MAIVTAVAVCYCAVVGTLLARSGARGWRHRSPSVAGRPPVPFPSGPRAIAKRPVLAFAAFHYFLGALAALLAVFRAAVRTGDESHGTLTLLAVTLIVLLSGIVLSVGAVFSITRFNRPRFLVPPDLREPVPVRREADGRNGVAPTAGGGSWERTVPPSPAARAEPGKGTLYLTRDPATWRDKWRAYVLVVDGVEVGTVRRGRTLTATVPAGHHVAWLRINWCSSPKLPLDVTEGTPLFLSCGPEGSDLGTARQMTEAPDTYLWLRPAAQG